MARGIAPEDQEEEDWFLERLHIDGFDSIQADKARLWILRGDWSFRGTRPRLEYSDFFPDVEKLKRIAESADLVVMTRNERTRLARIESRDRLGLGEGSYNPTAVKDSGKNDDLVARNIELGRQKIDLMAENERLEQENRDLRRSIERLRMQIEKHTKPTVSRAD